MSFVYMYLIILEERRKQDLMYKAERKKQRQVVEAADKTAKEGFKQEKELRSYSYVLS